MREEAKGRERAIDQYNRKEAPFYLEIDDEVSLFLAAYEGNLPVMLKGPTGCGKTRFLEHMAHRLGNTLITVACHEDLTANDLVGKFLLDAHGTVWCDGPLAIAVKKGAICYLDEIVEARKDTTVLIHPLTDNRRILPIEKTNQVIEAPGEFMLVISYNPGYQSVIKNLKQSTKQRFIAIDFDYPPEEKEIGIVAHEGGVSTDVARQLVKIGRKTRNLTGYGLEEGVSTRLLIYAAQLIADGIDPAEACEAALVQPISDDRDVQRSVEEIISSIL
jgi:nitric oxide reductase NorQ protein